MSRFCHAKNLHLFAPFPNFAAKSTTDSLWTKQIIHSSSHSFRRICNRRTKQEQSKFICSALQGEGRAELNRRTKQEQSKTCLSYALRGGERPKANPAATRRGFDFVFVRRDSAKLMQASLYSRCSVRCNPQLKDRANGEGLQIPLFKAVGLQIRPNG